MAQMALHAALDCLPCFLSSTNAVQGGAQWSHACRVLADGERDGGQADQVRQRGKAHHRAQQRQVGRAALQVLRAARSQVPHVNQPGF